LKTIIICPLSLLDAFIFSLPDSSLAQKILKTQSLIFKDSTLFVDPAGPAAACMPLRQVLPEAGESLVEQTGDRIHKRQVYNGTNYTINFRSRERLPDCPECLYALVDVTGAVDDMQFVHECSQGDAVGFGVEVRRADIDRQKFAVVILAQIVFYLGGAYGTGSVVKNLNGKFRFSRHGSESFEIWQ
jgi:hypothetical protein